MRVLGITGGSGAGKSLLTAQLAALGAAVIDCDRVYAALLGNSAPLRHGLNRRFPGILQKDGIDRAALRAIVFADPAALEDLNRLTHPYVLEETQARLDTLEREGRDCAAVEAIYLLESGLGALCCLRVAVTAPRERRVERIMARDGLSRQEAEARIGAQRDDDYYRRHCDHTIQNNGDPGLLGLWARRLYPKPPKS